MIWISHDGSVLLVPQLRPSSRGLGLVVYCVRGISGLGFGTFRRFLVL